VKGTKAHPVGWQIVGSLLNTRVGRRSAKTKKADREDCPSEWLL